VTPTASATGKLPQRKENHGQNAKSYIEVTFTPKQHVSSEITYRDVKNLLNYKVRKKKTSLRTKKKARNNK